MNTGPLGRATRYKEAVHSKALFYLQALSPALVTSYVQLLEAPCTSQQFHFLTWQALMTRSREMDNLCTVTT